MSDVVKTAHCVGQMVFHFEWCTKYRHKVFRNQKYKILCEAALLTAAERHKIEILEFSVMPDHVNVVVQTPFNVSGSQALQYLKGYSSFVLLKIYPELRSLYFWGCEGVWSPGKFARTVGDVNLQNTLSYVKNQHVHHAKQAILSSYGL